MTFVSHFLLCAALAAPLPTTAPAGGVRVVTSEAVGLGPESGIGRRDPSDVIRIGEQDFVFYTRLTAQTPLYPANYAGEIWYAVSEDAGRTWRERGRVLSKGRGKSFDSIGVFAPNVLVGADGKLLLYYSGVGPTFNFRFEGVRRVEPVSIGLASLSIDAEQGTARAERLNKGAPILGPSDRATRKFDSLRVTGATPILRNGIYQLYYRAYDFANPSGSSSLGLASAAHPAGPYRKQHEGRTVLPFSGDVLLEQHAGGLLALVTGGQRGLLWAADGEHFAPIPVHVSGRLDDPGLARAIVAEPAQGARLLWGLHVARERPDPYLERFDLTLPADLPLPHSTTIPVPNPARDVRWTQDSSWLGVHRRSLKSLADRPRDLIFIGDGAIQGFGGHDRIDSPPGGEVWQRFYDSKQAINLGLGGDRTEHVLWRIGHGILDRGRARAVVLQIGGNNIGRDEPGEIAAGVEAILRRVQHSIPRTQVVLVSILPPSRGDETARKAITACNAKLAHIARGPRVRFLDLTARLVDADGYMREELRDVDQSQLSLAGYREWADAMAPLLEGILSLVPESASRRLDELGGDR